MAPAITIWAGKKSQNSLRFTHPMTADAGQILTGSVGPVFCFLAVFFPVWESR
jgi:hypothetical protein